MLSYSFVYLLCKHELNFFLLVKTLFNNIFEHITKFCSLNNKV